jgi:hypothetical protein
MATSGRQLAARLHAEAVRGARDSSMPPRSATYVTAARSERANLRHVARPLQ